MRDFSLAERTVIGLSRESCYLQRMLLLFLAMTLTQSTSATPTMVATCSAVPSLVELAPVCKHAVGITRDACDRRAPVAALDAQHATSWFIVGWSAMAFWFSSRF